jgi:hypothetical protein
MLQGLSIAIGGASSDVNLYGGFLGAKISWVKKFLAVGYFWVSLQNLMNALYNYANSNY